MYPSGAGRQMEIGTMGPVASPYHERGPTSVGADRRGARMQLELGRPSTHGRSCRLPRWQAPRSSAGCAARLILRDPDRQGPPSETLVRAWRYLPTLRSPRPASTPASPLLVRAASLVRRLHAIARRGALRIHTRPTDERTLVDGRPRIRLETRLQPPSNRGAGHHVLHHSSTCRAGGRLRARIPHVTAKLACTERPVPAIALDADSRRWPTRERSPRMNRHEGSTGRCLLAR